MNPFPPSTAQAHPAAPSPTRPLAHAIALRLLTSKGSDAAGLKAYVAAAGLAEAMVDVLEELTRRVRAMRVEFEDMAAPQRPPAPAEPAPPPPAAPPAGPPPRSQAINPGY
jgi:hypothetical protein